MRRRILAGSHAGGVLDALRAAGSANAQAAFACQFYMASDSTHDAADVG
jgi:hypothetical protein